MRGISITFLNYYLFRYLINNNIKFMIYKIINIKNELDNLILSKFNPKK